MAIKKFSKVKIVSGEHKGKSGVCKSFMGEHDIMVELSSGELVIVRILDVKKA